jgi:hypothetical protein
MLQFSYFLYQMVLSGSVSAKWTSCGRYPFYSPSSTGTGTYDFYSWTVTQVPRQLIEAELLFPVQREERLRELKGGEGGGGAILAWCLKQFSSLGNIMDWLVYLHSFYSRWALLCSNFLHVSLEGDLFWFKSKEIV